MIVLSTEATKSKIISPVSNILYQTLPIRLCCSSRCTFLSLSLSEKRLINLANHYLPNPASLSHINALLLLWLRGPRLGPIEVQFAFCKQPLAVVAFLENIVISQRRNKNVSLSILLQKVVSNTISLTMGTLSIPIKLDSTLAVKMRCMCVRSQALEDGCQLLTAMKLLRDGFILALHEDQKMRILGEQTLLLICQAAIRTVSIGVDKLSDSYAVK